MPATAAPRTLFVLGGGGALGAYQAGGLLALAEAGVRPDALYGCSAGALNAAFVAADPSPECVAELAEWWVGGRARGVLTPGLGPRLRTLAAALTARSDGLLDARPLRRLVAARVLAEDLTDLPVPVTVTTTCLDCGAARHHREGPVVDLLAASCALPGLFPPVRLPDGHVHVDGGVLCGVPVAQALADAGPRDRVVVLDCGLAATTGRLGCCGTPLGGDGVGCDVPGAPVVDGLGVGVLDGDVLGDPGPSSEAAQEEACGLPVARPGRRYRAPVESSKGALDVVLRSFTLARAVANRASLAGALADPRVRVVPHVGDAWVAGLLDELPAGPRDVTHLPALVAAGADATRAWLATGALPGAAPGPVREQVLAAGPLVAAEDAGAPGDPATAAQAGDPGVPGGPGELAQLGEAATLAAPARRERRAGDRRRARRRTTDRPGRRAASRALAALPEPDGADPVVVPLPARAGEAGRAEPGDPVADDLSG